MTQVPKKNTSSITEKPDKYVLLLLNFWPIILLLLYFSLFYLTYFNLFNSDIGRHIANGKEVVANNFSVLYKNYYTFTQTDFPTINHHWLFGVVVYWLVKNSGLLSLTWFNWFLNTAAFGLVLWTGITKAEYLLQSTQKKTNDKTVKSNIKKPIEQTASFINPNTLSISIVSSVIGFFCMPLLTHRTEVRPESVSLLFFALYFFIFSKFSAQTNTYNDDLFNQISAEKSHKISVTELKSDNNITNKTPLKLIALIIRSKLSLFVVLALVQILWVNTHLFFIFGPLLAGYFLFERSLLIFFQSAVDHTNFRFEFKNLFAIFATTIKKIQQDIPSLFFVLTLVILISTSLLNPHKLEGLIAPLKIFENYAYRVAENQSTFFMIKYGSQVFFYSYVIFLSCIVLMIGIFTIYSNISNKKLIASTQLAQSFLLIIFAILANKINRMTPFFAVVLIPFIIENSFEPIKKLLTKYQKSLQQNAYLIVTSTVSIIIFFGILKLGFFTPSIYQIGAGPIPNFEKPAQFFKENNLHGPIFNNYDIGGYLEFTIFPTEKLFIDNRPEAYSKHFLQNEYLAALKDETIWENISQKYNLNTIFFFRFDQIDGAQEFMFKRVVDPKWVPVFVDDFTLILVKNSENNQQIIDQFQLPNEMFKMNQSNI